MPFSLNSSFDREQAIADTRNCSLSGIDTLSGLTCVSLSDSWRSDQLQHVITLGILIPVSLLGNITIVYVLTCGHRRRQQQQQLGRVNLFIVHLALADLAVCVVTMTSEILFVLLDSWMLGNAACKVVVWLQVVTLASTTFILMAMSRDRYVAICHPLQHVTTTLTKRIIALCWFLACIFALPQLFIFRTVARGIYPDGTLRISCASRGYTAWWQRKLYFSFLTVYILVVPSIVITFCYVKVVRKVWQHTNTEIAVDSNSTKNVPPSSGPKGRSNRIENTTLRRHQTAGRDKLSNAKIKTVKMTLAIICSFISFWTPYFVVHLVHIWSEYKYRIPQSVFAFSDSLALANSAINPIIYGFFNLRLASRFVAYLCGSNEESPTHRSEYFINQSRMLQEEREAHSAIQRQSSVNSSRKAMTSLRQTSSSCFNTTGNDGIDKNTSNKCNGNLGSELPLNSQKN